MKVGEIMFKIRTFGLATFLLVAALLFGNSALAGEFKGLPNSALTPGALNILVTQSTISTTICEVGYTDKIRPASFFTSKLKSEQLKSGYIVNGQLSAYYYEEDHLVPLEIGGSPTSTLNLWPEPLKGSRGAQVKDTLENKLHLLICAKKLKLAEAQQIFMSDWTAGYLKYLGAFKESLSVPSASPSATARATSSPKPSEAPLPSASPSPTEAPLPSPKPSEAPLPSPSPTEAPPKLQIVTPGAFCAPAGSTGVNGSGVLYACKTSSTDARNRWRQ
jgi:hypothetical protein